MAHVHKVKAILRKEYSEQFEELCKAISHEIRVTLLKGNYKRLKMDVNTMWVSKGQITPRGKKITRQSEMHQLEQQGEKFRTVLYPNKATRKLLRKVAEPLERLTLNEQKGFKSNANVFHALLPHRENISSLILDGESAFNTIPKSFVKDVCTKLLRLSTQEASFISNVCTYDGYLYQGNPISPIFYNIFQVVAIYRLRKLKNVTVTSYADDIIISTPFEYISWGYRRFILSVLNESGIKVNDKKTRFEKVERSIKLGGQVKTGEVARKQTFKGKIRLFKHLQKLGLNTTKRLNKQGEFIAINQMISGLEAWLNFPEDKRNGMVKGKTKGPQRLPQRQEPTGFNRTSHSTIRASFCELMFNCIKQFGDWQVKAEEILAFGYPAKLIEQIASEMSIEINVLLAEKSILYEY